MSITYDWHRIRREYRKLGIPEGIFDPTDAPIERNKYFIICTERSSGKTTNVLLLGLVCYRLYKTPIQYIRQTDDMLAPKNMTNLMHVIISEGYVDKLTDGKYNTLVYKARRWYYARMEDEEIKEQSPEACAVCLSIQSNEVYKSSYNTNGDFIVFDEFCSLKRHLPDEFVKFCDLCSTIIRSRTNPVIWLLGNTVDRYEYYFDELEIAEHIRYLQIGDSMEVKTSKGTPIYINLYSSGQKKQKSIVNRLFFGFKNTKLNAITGDDWLIVPYQHIDSSDEREVIDRTHFLRYEEEILQLEVCVSEKYGLHVIVHRSTNHDPEGGSIYTCDQINDIRYRFRFGHSRIDKMIWTLYDRNMFFYATNSCASIMNKYINRAKNIKP